MTRENGRIEVQESNDGYLVNCDECGVVEFDISGNVEGSSFGDIHATLYYAGLHHGKQHPESDMDVFIIDDEPGQ